jgi:hypothetical protein
MVDDAFTENEEVFVRTDPCRPVASSVSAA